MRYAFFFAFVILTAPFACESTVVAPFADADFDAETGADKDADKDFDADAPDGDMEMDRNEAVDLDGKEAPEGTDGPPTLCHDLCRGRCEVQIDDCICGVCEEHATCNATSCACDDGYEDPDIDGICTPLCGLNCGEHGRCDATADPVVCVCDVTYEFDGQTCIPVKSCQQDSDCDDGLACNGTERCHAGQCQDGVEIDCGAWGRCAEPTGVCLCLTSAVIDWDAGACVQCLDDTHCRDDYRTCYTCDTATHQCVASVLCPQGGHCCGQDVFDRCQPHTCACESGYKLSEDGLSCQGLCEGVQCEMADTHCVVTDMPLIGIFPFCLCKAGYCWKDDQDLEQGCVTNAKKCAQVQCSGGKICTCGTCDCPAGYTGTNCTECAGGYQDNDHNGSCLPACNSTCGYNTTCSDASGAVVCSCQQNTAGDPATGCEEICPVIGTTRCSPHESGRIQHCEPSGFGPVWRVTDTHCRSDAATSVCDDSGGQAHCVVCAVDQMTCKGADIYQCLGDGENNEWRWIHDCRSENLSCQVGYFGQAFCECGDNFNESVMLGGDPYQHISKLNIGPKQTNEYSLPVFAGQFIYIHIDYNPASGTLLANLTLFSGGFPLPSLMSSTAIDLYAYASSDTVWYLNVEHQSGDECIPYEIFLYQGPDPCLQNPCSTFDACRPSYRVEDAFTKCVDAFEPCASNIDCQHHPFGSMCEVSHEPRLCIPPTGVCSQGYNFCPQGLTCQYIASLIPPSNFYCNGCGQDADCPMTSALLGISCYKPQGQTTGFCVKLLK